MVGTHLATGAVATASQKTFLVGGRIADPVSFWLRAEAPTRPARASSTRKRLRPRRFAEERSKRVEAERAASKAIQQSEAQLAAYRAQGQKAASLLEFNEETTRRRLLDQDLLDAGWKVGPNGQSTDEVGQEANP